MSIYLIIIDYGSGFVTYGNEIESKRVQFLGRDGPDKISGGGYSAVAPDASKICGFVPQEHQQGTELTFECTCKVLLVTFFFTSKLVRPLANSFPLFGRPG